MARKNKHAHHDCEHDLKFCAPCNEAYCLKCEAVWSSEPCAQTHYPWYVTTTPAWGTTTVTDNTGDDIRDYYTSTVAMHSAC